MTVVAGEKGRDDGEVPGFDKSRGGGGSDCCCCPEDIIGVDGRAAEGGGGTGVGVGA